MLITGEKRKRIPEEIPQRQSTVKEAVRKVTSEKETSSEDVPVEAATHMRAELPDDVKDERPPSRNSDEVLPEVCHFALIRMYILWRAGAGIRMKDTIEKITRLVLFVGLVSARHPGTDSIYEDEGEKASAGYIC